MPCNSCAGKAAALAACSSAIVLTMVELALVGPAHATGFGNASWTHVNLSRNTCQHGRVQPATGKKVLGPQAAASSLASHGCAVSSVLVPGTTDRMSMIQPSMAMHGVNRPHLSGTILLVLLYYAAHLVQAMLHAHAARSGSWRATDSSVQGHTQQTCTTARVSAMRLARCSSLGSLLHCCASSAAGVRSLIACISAATGHLSIALLQLSPGSGPYCSRLCSCSAASVRAC